jgi:hypothetical protein
MNYTAFPAEENPSTTIGHDGFMFSSRIRSQLDIEGNFWKYKYSGWPSILLKGPLMGGDNSGRLFTFTITAR